jgi:calcineurin-like phosphoesterase
MCGDYNSVIWHGQGGTPEPFPAQAAGGEIQAGRGAATVCGVAVETDDRTGLASQISPIRLGGRLSQAEVPFW